MLDPLNDTSVMTAKGHNNNVAGLLATATSSDAGAAAAGGMATTAVLDLVDIGNAVAAITIEEADNNMAGTIKAAGVNGAAVATLTAGVPMLTMGTTTTTAAPPHADQEVLYRSAWLHLLSGKCAGEGCSWDDCRRCKGIMRHRLSCQVGR